MEKNKLERKIKKKKDKKGFTLIELLAVIIILGILLLIAVPAISRYIEDSRKDTYINSLRSVVTAISTSVNALEYSAIGVNEGLIIPFSEANLEKGTTKTRSPYAQYQEGKSYVLVTFDGQRYNYYVATLDEAGYAIPLINEKELSSNSITTNSNVINNNVYSTSDIVEKGLIDTSNLTFKYIETKDEVIKVKMCELTYSIGDRIQLKDGSKWYVIADSSEEDKTVSLLSYNHMETTSNIGSQSLQKNNPRIHFDTIVVGTGETLTTLYEDADIKTIVDRIITNMQTNFTIDGINYTGAEIKMPQLSDFSGRNNVSNWGNKWTFYRTDNNGPFWLKDKHLNANYAYYVDIDGTTVGAFGAGASYDQAGIRIVINNLLKSNIDKAVTKGLN